MTKRFNNLTVTINNDGSVSAGIGVPRYILSESELDSLADDIRSAQCWLRDVRRKQADNETPELPMT